MAELLIDYIEDAAQFIKKKKSELHRLEDEYKEAYSKDVREEMDIIKKEINKKKSELVERLYESVEELNSIKKYFPDFFNVLLEDEDVGRIMKRHDVLYDRLKIPNARNHLEIIRRGRAQLKDAIAFLERWPGVIKEKQLTATYPILKGAISGDMESEDAIEKIKEMERTLMREGWKVILSNDELTLEFVEKYIKKLKMAEHDLAQAKINYSEAKEKGTVAENSALIRLRNAEKRKARLEKKIRRMLLANPELLANLKKKKWLSREKKTDLQKIVEKVTPKKIREMVWLKEMKKRLG